MRLLRLLLMSIGGLAIVALFFFATLFVLQYLDPGARDRIRAEQVKSLRTAIENYRNARGSYPVYPDNPVDDLKKDLVDTGFITAIPADPLRGSPGGQQYRYVSDGKLYGLLVKLETGNGKIPPGGLCMTGVGIKGSGIWGGPPDCPF
jgi:type II secretory pathway pseudopilin PulG